MNETEQKCKQLLKDEGINGASKIDFDVNGELHALSLNYIIEIYMQASQESQLVFFSAMQKSLEVKEGGTMQMGIDKFFEGMGQLLLMTHLSDKIEV